MRPKGQNERSISSNTGLYTLSYAYNLGGELTSVINPFSAQVGYNYDKMGRPTAVTGAGYAGVSSYVNSLSYRAFGMKQMGYANGKTLSINYDNRMRMTRWDVAGVLGSDYEYRWEDTFRPTMARSRTDATLDRWYNYDHVGRLHIGRSGSEARAAYGEAWNGLYDGPYSMAMHYDVWGNIAAKEGWGGDNPAFTATYTNNRRNGLTYDAAGNLTNDGGQNFTYDATGQQATASYSGYLLQQSYDGDRLRGKKVDNGTTTYYLRSSVLGGQVIAELNGSGAFTRGYVYLGGQLLAVQQNSAVSWVHQDPVTKSQRVTNAAGTVVSTIELDPWGGNTSRNSNDAFQPRKFTTYERDGNASDDAMHRRYNRWWSRFDQPDPYDGSYSLTNPQSFNRYAYVNNDPVNFVDPSGLVTCHVDPATGQTVCIPDITGGVTVNIPGSGSGSPGGGGGGGGGNEMIPEDLPPTEGPTGGGGGGIIPPGNVIQTMYNLLENERCRNFISNLLNAARQLTGIKPMSYSASDLIRIIASDPDGGYLFSPGYSGGLGGGEAGYGLGGPAVAIGGEGVSARAPNSHILAVRVNYALTGLHETIHLAPGGGRGYSDRILAQAVFAMFGDPKDDPSKVIPSRRAVYDYGGIWDKYLREYCGARM